MTADHFTDIYNEQFIPNFRLALNITRNRNDAEDIVSDVFAKLWETTHHLSNIEGWLWQCTRNACISYLRRKNFRKTGPAIDDYMDEASDLRLIEQAEVKALYVAKMRKMIADLPSQCSIVCELAYIHGLSNAEISAALNITKRTVSNQKTIAKSILKCRFLLLLILHYISRI
jgi:RNA polymerase sigma factor (sigma-70 family)